MECCVIRLGDEISISTFILSVFTLGVKKKKLGGGAWDPQVLPLVTVLITPHKKVCAFQVWSFKQISAD